MVVHDEYVGEGYGILNQGVVEAIAQVARTEGILLDPVYTGKAMTGLLDLVRNGHFSDTDAVVFLHTGARRRCSRTGRDCWRICRSGRTSDLAQAMARLDETPVERLWPGSPDAGSVPA